MIINAFRKLADCLEDGSCEMTEAQMMMVLDYMADINDDGAHMSKEAACRYLHVSRSTFDRMVADGTLPHGRKRVGFKELFWRRSDLVLKDDAHTGKP